MANLIESLNLIAIFIALCVAAVLVIVLKKQVKKALFIAANGAAGLLAAFLINFAAAPLGFAVGLNFVNALFIGFLGVPGLVTLYIAAWVL